MTKKQFSIVRFALLIILIALGFYLYYLLKDLGKEAIFPAVGIPFALYLMVGGTISYFYSLEEQKKENFKKQLDAQSQILRALSENNKVSEPLKPKEFTAPPMIRELTVPIKVAAKELARPAIGFQPLYPNFMPSHDTGSWIGGSPYMRENAIWPTGKDWTTGDNVPLHFLAQIDCAALPTDPSLMMPKSGYLSFFASPEGNQTQVIYSPTSIAVRNFEAPNGIAPFLPKKNINTIEKVFMKPVLFQSTPSFDHLFGSTHTQPIYNRPDWEDEKFEAAAEALENLHRQSYDEALMRANISLSPDFKQLEPKVHIQSGGWIRSRNVDFPMDEEQLTILSFDLDGLSGKEFSVERDIVFLMSKLDFQKLKS